MVALPDRRFMVAVILVVFTTACGAADNHIDTVFDPCQPLVLTPSLSASSAELQSLRDAATMWNSLGTSITVAEAPPSADTATVDVKFESAAPMFYGVYLDQDGEVVINETVTDEHERAVVAAHEIGHAFGLHHVDPSHRQSVMNAGNVSTLPDAGDVQVLEKQWPSCALSAQ